MQIKVKGEIIRDIIPGTYKHFQGNMYRVIGIAKHTETQEPLVLYTPVYGSPDELFAKPLEMFASFVDREQYPDVLQQFKFERVS